MKKQWEKRVEVFQFIYTCLISEIPPSDYVVFSFEQNYEFDVNELKIIEYLSKNINSIINEIKPLLSDTWTWERMNTTDKSILLTSIAESRVLDTPRKVIIDQALITGRKYNIDDSYKFINPILDKLIKKDE